MIDSDFLPTGSPSDATEGVLREAFLHAEEGGWDRAAECLRDALEADPEDPYLLCWLGLAERELGLAGIAYERFKGALASSSDDPILLATAGAAIAAFDDPSAEPALRTATLLAPELSQTRLMYGAYLSREGMYPQAFEQLEAAEELDPESPMVQVELGVAHALAGELQAASQAFARSLELEPGNGWALVLLGLAELESTAFEDSVRPLEEGARARPEDGEAQLLAALALSASGWEERALEMLERARFAGVNEDESLASQVEEQIEAGEDAALEFLQDSFGPSSLRHRLMQRP